MPEFILDTSGEVPAAYGVPALDTLPERIEFRHLDAFTQGYIEALFFTDSGPEDGELGEAGFSDLAPETLARIIEDCAAFQRDNAKALEAVFSRPMFRRNVNTPTETGRDLWYTRNGHVCGFWDGDWPEPYATLFTEAAKAFGNVDSYLGDDGKVYLS